MLTGYTRAEIQQITNGMKEGKTYSEVIDELYPKTELECVYECALQNMRSFSLIETIYYAITRKEQPTYQVNCAEYCSI